LSDVITFSLKRNYHDLALFTVIKTLKRSMPQEKFPKAAHTLQYFYIHIYVNIYVYNLFI